jgi:hypothetical protein
MEELNKFIVAGSVCVAISIMINRFSGGFDSFGSFFLGVGLGLLVTGLYVRKHGDAEIKALKKKWLRLIKK